MLSRAISTCTLAERLATRGTSDKEELEKVSEKLSEKVSSIGQKFNGLMSRRSRKGSGFIGLLLGNTHHGIDGVGDAGVGDDGCYIINFTIFELYPCVG